jgi:TPR repeat protein
MKMEQELTKNLDEAIRLFYLSAEFDYAEPLFNLALCYEEGKGMKRITQKHLNYFLMLPIMV